MADVVVREASVEDAHALAVVHVRSWQVAYASIVPDEALGSLSVATREAAWQRRVEGQGPDQVTLLAECDGEVTGFVAIGPSRDDDATGDVGEVYALYVAPEWFAQGVGRELFSVACDRLASRYSQATLWVLAANTRARRFYEIAGWSPDGSERSVPSGRAAGLPQVRYRAALRPGR